MSWMNSSKEGVILTLKATPRASKTEIAGADEEWLRIRLQAPPVDGKANKELVDFFSRRLGISKRSVEILTGDTSRLKRVRLSGVSEKEIDDFLLKEGVMK